MGQVISGVGICIAFTVALVSGTSTQSAWTTVHFLQLIVILPLVAISMSRKVSDFIVSLSYTGFSTYSLSSCAIKSLPLLKNLSFDQPDEYLDQLGWQSGSSFINNLILFMVVIFLVMIHLLTLIIYCFTKNKETRLSKVVVKVYRFFTFAVYIRI